MPKTITMRVSDKVYELFQTNSKIQNCPLANYIETVVLKYIENHRFVDDFEMDNIQNDLELLKSIKKGSQDARNLNGEFV